MSQRIEVLKGPNAMIFGRGGGGGIINRVLKEADGSRVREVTVGAGQFNLGRVAVDFGDAINRTSRPLQRVFENSAPFATSAISNATASTLRDLQPTDATTIALSYEYFHDRPRDRSRHPFAGRAGVADRQSLLITSPSTFFGNPDLNYALVDAHIATAVIEHVFDNGLKVQQPVPLRATTTSSIRTSSRAAP